MKWQVKVFCLGMVSEQQEFATAKEADAFAAEMRRIPGMIPIVEEIE